MADDLDHIASIKIEQLGVTARLGELSLFFKDGETSRAQMIRMGAADCCRSGDANDWYCSAD